MVEHIVPVSKNQPCNLCKNYKYMILTVHDKQDIATGLTSKGVKPQLFPAKQCYAAFITANGLAPPDSS